MQNILSKIISSSKSEIASFYPLRAPPPHLIVADMSATFSFFTPSLMSKSSEKSTLILLLININADFLKPNLNAEFAIKKIIYSW